MTIPTPTAMKMSMKITTYWNIGRPAYGPDVFLSNPVHRDTRAIPSPQQDSAERNERDTQSVREDDTPNDRRRYLCTLLQRGIGPGRRLDCQIDYWPVARRTHVVGESTHFASNHSIQPARVCTGLSARLLGCASERRLSAGKAVGTDCRMKAFGRLRGPQDSYASCSCVFMAWSASGGGCTREPCRWRPRGPRC